MRQAIPGKFLSFLATLVLAIAVSATAQATTFTYDLDNHPDGNAAPPYYGMRLDELFNVTSGHDIFTFDFNNASSTMTLVLDDGGTVNSFGDDSVTISGIAYGGLDTGTGYTNATYAGLWTINFVYTVNITSTGPTGNNIIVGPASTTNTGSITPNFNIGGNMTPIVLYDMAMDGISFNFNNTADHRLDCMVDTCGPTGFVGWGWLNHHSTTYHVDASDWLFTATKRPSQDIPEPASVLLLGTGLVGLARSIRHRKQG